MIFRLRLRMPRGFLVQTLLNRIFGHHGACGILAALTQDIVIDGVYARDYQGPAEMFDRVRLAL